MADQQGEPQRERVLARDHADDVRHRLLERVADGVVVGVLEPAHVGAGRLERGADLVVEVADPCEQDLAAVGHGRFVPA